MSVCLSGCGLSSLMPGCVYAWIFVCLYVSYALTGCLSWYQEGNLDVHLDICLSGCVVDLVYVCLSGCLSLWMSWCMYVCLNICMNACLDVYFLELSMPVWMSDCLSFYMTDVLSCWLDVWMSVFLDFWVWRCLPGCLYGYLDVLTSACLSVGLPVCMS